VSPLIANNVDLCTFFKDGLRLSLVLCAESKPAPNATITILGDKEEKKLDFKYIYDGPRCLEIHIPKSNYLMNALVLRMTGFS
jgi:hypothetical protein